MFLWGINKEKYEYFLVGKMPYLELWYIFKMVLYLKWFYNEQCYKEHPAYKRSCLKHFLSEGRILSTLQNGFSQDCLCISRSDELFCSFLGIKC